MTEPPGVDDCAATASPGPPGPRDARLVARWARRNLLPEVVPTPLLAARLRLRRRAVVVVLGLWVLAQTVVLWAIGRDPFGLPRPPHGQLRGILAGLVVVLLLVLAMAVPLAQGADRRLAVRAGAWGTRPASPVRLITRRSLVALAILYAAPVWLCWYAAFGPHPDRSLAAGALAGLVLLLAVSLPPARVVRRRPAIGRDPGELLADAVLRANDLRMVLVGPAPWALSVVLVDGLVNPPAWLDTAVKFGFWLPAAVAAMWVTPDPPRPAAPAVATVPPGVTA